MKHSHWQYIWCSKSVNVWSRILCVPHTLIFKIYWHRVWPNPSHNILYFLHLNTVSEFFDQDFYFKQNSSSIYAVTVDGTETTEEKLRRSKFIISGSIYPQYKFRELQDILEILVTKNDLFISRMVCTNVCHWDIHLIIMEVSCNIQLWIFTLIHYCCATKVPRIEIIFLTKNDFVEGTPMVRNWGSN